VTVRIRQSEWHRDPNDVPGGVVRADEPDERRPRHAHPEDPVPEEDLADEVGVAAPVGVEEQEDPIGTVDIEEPRLPVP
jgi:hypothetical protein